MPAWSSKRRVRALARFRRDERGVSAIEFAMALPVLLILVAGIIEVGHVVSQATTIEQSLRAGAFYAARNQQYPLTAAVRTTVDNLVKYGDPNGGAAFNVSGWALPGANLTIDDTATYDVNGTLFPIVKLTATVPFDPLLSGVLPLPAFNIVLRHEQTFLGD